MARMELVICGKCGKQRYAQRSYTLKPWFTGLCRDCSRRSRSAEKNPVWKGGRHKTMQGYIDIRLFPNDSYYAMASKKWHYCREHRYVMARHLGRCLSSKETVHHLNGIKDDNRLENLELISQDNHHLRTTLCHNCKLRKDIKVLLSQNKVLLEQIRELNIKEWGIE